MGKLFIQINDDNSFYFAHISFKFKTNNSIILAALKNCTFFTKKKERCRKE